jgi:ankyrin repeat protein
MPATALAALLLSLPATASALDDNSSSTHPVADESLFSLMERHEGGWSNLEFANRLHARPELASVRNTAGETPLHVAARKRYENEVFLLLHAGADVNARDAQGRTPLHLVAGQAHEDAWMIRDMLVIKNAALDAVAEDGTTPLMIATCRKNLRTVEFLVWAGASLGTPEGSTQPSPHAVALAEGFEEAAALLANASGGNAITIKARRQIPPHVSRSFTDAAAKKDYALLNELMIEGVGIDTQDSSGATALHRAVYRAHEDVVTYLLMLGANPNLANESGNTPYMSASGWFGLSMDWMRAMLLLAGSDVHGPINQQGFSPLGQAVHSGNEESAQLLIWRGVDPRKPAGTKGTPLEIACRGGAQRLIDLLRRNGVTDPEFVDPLPQKRLEQYVKRGLVPQVKELVAGGGVSLESLTDAGRTLMVEAVHARYPQMVDLLLELGADPEQRCKDGSTLLHATTAWNYSGINDLRNRLIERKVNLNAADQNGLTALMKASRHGEDWLGLRQLVSAGADLAARDKKGRTALDLALQSGREGATRYLLSVKAPHTDPETVEATN